MKKWLWLTVVSIVLIGFSSLLQYGPTYIGKSYDDTIDFKADYQYFTDHLIALELDPPEAQIEETVAAEEIETYRTQFGSLAEQVSSIQDQYTYDIEEARAAENDSLEEVLTQERDSKIEEIRKNFSDNEAIIEKILEERQAEAAQSIRQVERQKSYFSESSSYYTYRLTDVANGEVFTKGQIGEDSYFEKKYTAGRPLMLSANFYENMGIENISGTNAQYEGTVQVDRSLLMASPNGETVKHFNFVQIVLYVFGALAIAGTALVLTKLRLERKWFTSLETYSKWSSLTFEVRAIAALLSLVIALSALSNFLMALQYNWTADYQSYGTNLIFHFGTAWVFIALTILQTVWLVSYYRTTSFKEEFLRSLLLRSILSARLAFLKKSIGKQSLILLIVVFFWGFGTLGVLLHPQTLLVWLPATLFIGIPVLLFMMNRFGYMNVLMEKTENMAEGRLNEDIPVRGKSPLADHARQLNRLKEGVRMSMSEQAKSERLKTELITNVSHDLRTPLTSIITYSDLMKTPNLSEEERLAYADILDRKSQRLKTLIEDLFEVSKMASGNMELQRTRLDVSQLLQQALAEHAEDIEASGLDFRVSSAEQPLYIHADGQKWWRVLDNLILNAIKYAMPGTRVYASLAEVDGQAEFVLKNVTRYELGENTDELFERFKRGDASRQTEGSGLGLAIAQSIVELHGGVLKIEVDGDLFKVTVSIMEI